MKPSDPAAAGGNDDPSRETASSIGASAPGAAEIRAELRQRYTELLLGLNATAPQTPGAELSRTQPPTEAQGDGGIIVPAPGVRLGDIVLEAELGHGGMGVVFKARDLRLDRPVAVKFLLPERAAREKATERFRREATIGAKPGIPGVCRVLDFGEFRGLHYIVMEFIEGATLHRHLVDAAKTPLDARSPVDRADRAGEAPSATTLPLETGTPSSKTAVPTAPDASTTQSDSPATQLDRGIHWIEQAALSVHACHEHGVIHRDLKPSNIMIRSDGVPVVLDFGLAFDSQFDGTSRLSTSGHPMGTPEYMAPEQVEGRLDAIDRRTDVYALGVILYEWLTLKRPFSAATPQACYYRIVNEAPTDPRAVRPGIAADLSAVCLKAMAKRPDDRYATAAAFARDLRHFLRGEPTTARPPTTTQQLIRRVRKWRWQFTATALAVVALALAFRPGSSGPSPTIVQARERTRTARLQYANQDYAGAAESFAKAVEVLRTDPSMTPDNEELLSVRLNLAQALASSKKIDQAGVVIDEVLATAERKLGPSARFVLQARLTKAVVVRALEGPEASLPIQQAAIDGLAKILPADDEVLLNGRGDLAATEHLLGHLDVALRIQQDEVLPGLQRLRGPDAMDVLGLQVNIAGTLVMLGRFAEAERLSAEVIPKLADAGVSEKRAVRQAALGTRALALYKLGRFAEARQIQVDLVGVRERNEGPQSQQLAASRLQLALTLMQLDDVEGAAAQLAAIADAFPSVISPSNPDLHDLRESVAEVLFRRGDVDQAIACLAALVDEYEETPPENPKVQGRVGARLAALRAAAETRRDPASRPVK